MPSPQDVAYRQRYNNFVDAIALNTAIVPNPYVYQSLCHEALESVRLANNYRPKIYAVPDQSVFGTLANPGLPPFTDYMSQVRMLPGTLVTGFSLTIINFFGGGGSGIYSAQAFNLANNFYVGVEDDATGLPFFSDWLTELVFNVPTLYNATGHASVPDYVAKTAWLPLTRPRAVLSPGIVTVKMCYKGTPSSSQNISPQLLIMCAEPCSVLRGISECE